MSQRWFSSRNSLNILFTCIGRRVSLLGSFRKAANRLNVKLSVFGTERTNLSPALQLCDGRFIVKSVTHRRYIEQLLAIVKKNKIKLLIPTVDLDLKSLAKNKSHFEKLGCCVLISKPGVVDICQDKRQTYRFLRKKGFATPVTMSPATALSQKKINWPCFLKPRDGYASRGTAIANNRKELLFYSRKIPNCIVQEFIDADEYTCDAYVDFNMNVRFVVPRKRIEVRAGEVSKAQIVMNTSICKQTAKLVKALGAGPGVITVQLFLTGTGQVKFIEVNPRFGGGVPLSIKAGANSPKWILQELLGRKTLIKPEKFKDGLIMLRYDSEVWAEKV